MCDDLKLDLEFPSGLVSFSEKGVSLLVSLEIPLTVKFKQDGTQGTAELYTDDLLKAIVPSSQSRNALIRTIHSLEKKLKIAKNNHEDLKKRNQLLRDRPDLPVDRLSVHRDMEKLQNRVACLEQTVSQKDNAIKRLQRRLSAQSGEAPHHTKTYQLVHREYRNQAVPEEGSGDTGLCPFCRGSGKQRVIVNESNPYLALGTETEITCTGCRGTGRANPCDQPCDFCGGLGSVTVALRAPFTGPYTGVETCPVCNGTGKALKVRGS